MESEEYARAFSNLRIELDVPSSVKAVLKKFVCHLYGVEIKIMSILSVTYCLKEGNLKRSYYHQMSFLWSSM